MPFELLNPTGLEPPVGYAHVAKIIGGNIVHVAGQAPFNEKVVRVSWSNNEGFQRTLLWQSAQGVIRLALANCAP